MQIQDVPWDQKHLIQAAENVDLQTYVKTPVSKFGLMMLQKMGLDEDKKIGKNTENALVKPIEYIPRPAKSGLGSLPNLVSQAGKAYKSIDEKVRLSGIQKLQEVQVLYGKCKNLRGIVIDIQRDEKDQVLSYTIQLKINEENIKCAKDQITDQLQEEKTKSRSRSKEIDKKIKWIQPGIKVKVKSKTYNQGKLYNKKLYINDVYDDYRFLASSSDGQTYDDLCEQDVKPCLPSSGGKVMILNGEQQIGVYMKKLKKKKAQILVDGQEMIIERKKICSIQ